MGCGWEPVTLGRTGLRSSALGLAAGYGADGRDVERAFERGVNYFYLGMGSPTWGWASWRRADFARGVSRLARRHRERMVTVVQTYARAATLVGPAVELTLAALRLEYADLLLLPWWNEPPSARVRDAAIALRDRGRVGDILVSCHHRPSFARYAADPGYGAIMLRYNAAHPGAEGEVFPHLATANTARPGVVAFTATRWGTLLDPRLTPPGERTPAGADCYRFVLSNPHVDVCLCGPANASELRDALGALDRGPMDASELGWMRRVGAAVRARSNQHRAR
jgi:aryl-alcohol dehydrogenase-like predicted oxidoreductase